MGTINATPIKTWQITIIILLASTIGISLFVITPKTHAAVNPLSGAQLYVDPNSNPAANQATTWRNTRPADAAQMDKIALQPKSYWMGDWTPNSLAVATDYTSRAQASGKVGTIVAYNIPARDCGSYSAGGASSHAAYRNWIDGIAGGIASRKTVVVLEPDALASMNCLDINGKNARIESINYAITKLVSAPGALVYIDIGNSGWLSVATAVSQLQKVAIGTAAGFALNVSNFYTTTSTTTYGLEISKHFDGKHFIIDTSRNGLGSNGEWCNPSGRALGQNPTTVTSSHYVDAYLWIKYPGESDGTCNSGPSAGTWWPDYALGLAKQAVTSDPSSGAHNNQASNQTQSTSKQTPATPTTKQSNQNQDSGGTSAVKSSSVTVPLSRYQPASPPITMQAAILPPAILVAFGITAGTIKYRHKIVAKAKRLKFVLSPDSKL